MIKIKLTESKDAKNARLNKESRQIESMYQSGQINWSEYQAKLKEFNKRCFG